MTSKTRRMMRFLEVPPFNVLRPVEGVYEVLPGLCFYRSDVIEQVRASSEAHGPSPLGATNSPDRNDNCPPKEQRSER